MTPMTRGTFVAGSSLTALGLHALACGSAMAGVVAPPPAAPLGAAMAVTLDVNGIDRNLVLDPRTTLLDALRDRLGLTGTKKGCDQGTCGACTVIVNDRRIVSCLTLAVMHAGDRIVTIEGIRASGGSIRCSGVHQARRFSMRLLHAGADRFRRRAAQRRQEARPRHDRVE